MMITSIEIVHHPFGDVDYFDKWGISVYIDK